MVLRSSYILYYEKFTLFSLKLTSSCSLTRRFNYLHRTFQVRLKVGPLEHVPHPWMARLGHGLDLFVSYHVIPDVDTCHFTDETLIGIKGSSQWVLLLAKNQCSTATDHITFKSRKAMSYYLILLTIIDSFLRKITRGNNSRTGYGAIVTHTVETRWGYWVTARFINQN